MKKSVIKVIATLAVLASVFSVSAKDKFRTTAQIKKSKH